MIGHTRADFIRLAGLMRGLGLFPSAHLRAFHALDYAGGLRRPAGHPDTAGADGTRPAGAAHHPPADSRRVAPAGSSATAQRRDRSLAAGGAALSVGKLGPQG